MKKYMIEKFVICGTTKYKLYKRINFLSLIREHFALIFIFTLATLGTIWLFMIAKALLEGEWRSLFWESIGDFTNFEEAISAKINDEEENNPERFYL